MINKKPQTFGKSEAFYFQILLIHKKIGKLAENNDNKNANINCLHHFLR
jgi:hypothetical protein